MILTIKEICKIVGNQNEKEVKMKLSKNNINSAVYRRNGIVLRGYKF